VIDVDLCGCDVDCCVVVCLYIFFEWVCVVGVFWVLDDIMECVYDCCVGL